MDDQNAFDLITALMRVCETLDKQNGLHEEANDLMRSLIPALETNAQELFELVEQLKKSGV